MAPACAHLPFKTPLPLRILVLNMHAGKDAAGKPNLDGVAALVKSTAAEIVLLQEVDRGTARSGKVDQVQRLQALTGYSTAFAPSLRHYDGGEYGIAVLSRGYVGYTSTSPLPVSPAETRAGGSSEPRVALVAIANVRGANWHVVNTHLDPAEGAARGQEVGRLVELVHDQQAAGVSLLVGGDFNSTPDNAVLAPLRAAGLRDAWTECGSGDGFTYPADKPVKRIDYLFLSGSIHCSAASVLDTQVSDHRPVLITLR
ncbi:MAG TPA: endonuclease/exonuclease/phosphatase family protein [Vicinamibacterales bacterium]|nr:endonuclease/exonuclease/phosphatase family protein [Vicinamibacterales bacterium]